MEKKIHWHYLKDNYFWGPEYKADDSQKGIELKGRLVPAGDYRIKVFSPSNQGKYSLVVGYLEEFSLKDIFSIVTVPQIKLKFFGDPLSEVLLSPFGWGSILVFYLFAFIVGFILRAILKKAAKDSLHRLGKYINKHNHLLHVAIGIGLLVWAITSTWNPILLFFSGFVFFVTIFS